jgi:hypothetical protein
MSAYMSDLKIDRVLSRDFLAILFNRIEQINTDAENKSLRSASCADNSRMKVFSGCYHLMKIDGGLWPGLHILVRLEEPLPEAGTARPYYP